MLSARFRNGSMTKMFTGVAIGQLIQAGQVNPAAPVGSYLPDHPNRDVATKISIHHLLTHSGGTGDILPEYYERREQLRTIADYLALFGEREPRFEPGTRYEYSHYGFILLGAVIEAVSNPICGQITTFGHNGGGPGMSGDLSFWPNSGHIVAVLANKDWIATEVSGFICCHLPGTPT
jgi:hypothetical protein